MSSRTRTLSRQSGRSTLWLWKFLGLPFRVLVSRQRVGADRLAGLPTGKHVSELRELGHCADDPAGAHCGFGNYCSPASSLLVLDSESERSVSEPREVCQDIVQTESISLLDCQQLPNRFLSFETLSGHCPDVEHYCSPALPLLIRSESISLLESRQLPTVSVSGHCPDVRRCILVLWL